MAAQADERRLGVVFDGRRPHDGSCMDGAAEAAQSCLESKGAEAPPESWEHPFGFEGAVLGSQWLEKHIESP